MSRTVATLLLFTWVAATLMLAASCSQEPSAAVGSAEPAVDPPEMAEPAETPEPVETPEEPAEFAEEPAASSDTLDDPFAADDGLFTEMPDTEMPDTEMPDVENDEASPFDVPDELFAELDDLSDDPEREGARRPDVHFVPTPQEVVDRMLELAEVTEDDVVYDLGCGDGRIVVTAAKRYGCRALGVDIDPERVEESLKNVRDNNVEHLVEIKEGDIFEMDLTPATVITLYLLPNLNVKLIPQLEQLEPGTRIVSHAFDMRGVKPDVVETVETERGTSPTVYMWTTPLQKEEESDLEDPF